MNRSDDTLIYKLKWLRVAANNACNEAGKHKDEIGGPVNWLDLRCVGAEFAIDDGGNVHYRVIIEEATPEAVELQHFIEQELLAEWGHVNVVTGW